MTIFFVCRANVGRSQIAAALYSRLHRSDVVKSAGTRVDRPGELLSEYAQRHPGRSFVVPVLLEMNIDLSSSPRTPLTRACVERADLVVSMAEAYTEPKWLTDHPGYVHWDVEDPGGKSRAAVRDARDAIEHLIQREFQGTDDEVAEQAYL